MKKQVTLEVKKAISKTGKEYISATIDIGYRKVYPQFRGGIGELAEVLDMSPRELYKTLKEEAE